MLEGLTFKPPKCPDCKTETNMVGCWAAGDDDYALYQCPNCKAVIMKKVDLIPK